MSFDHTALAINANIPGPPSNKLALVILTNHLNKKTGLCNPSVAKVAKQLGLGEKQTRIVLQKLKSAGYISVILNSMGGHPGSTCHYKINTEKLKSNQILLIRNSPSTPPTHYTPTPPLDEMPTTPFKFPGHPHVVALTPPLDESQTKNEPYIKPSLIELESKYGKYWHTDGRAVREVGAMLRIPAFEREPACDYGDRLKALLT